MKAQSEELEIFVAVVDCGSISAAADQLGLTPSAISRSLARLERKFATTLLNRTTRRMELTEEGRFVLSQTRDILRRMETLEEGLALRRQRPAGRLRINAATPFMLHAILPHIDAFRADYPYVQLELNTDELNIDLLQQRTDIAIRIGPLSDSTLHARPLGRSRLAIMASPGYVQLHGTPRCPEDLLNHSLLGFTEPQSLNLWPLRQADGALLAIAPSVSASSGETLRQLALAGQGIACLSAFMTEADLQAGRLVRVLPELTEAQYQPIQAVYYRNAELALRIRCFLDFIQARLQGAFEGD
ncbi:LysR family transcriptional regulator [Pseudomonas sp. RIT-PI-AD]|uniref:LysR family transcriptional regulator n=1 Tax=Pseudomonas sp. RIT-PI-AD TaxID=3035294 RepID=UPI0021DABA04|nr:LysR family transcriptional regulator [Pseudomonas sp. RIT-PI-AD]